VVLRISFPAVQRAGGQRRSRGGGAERAVTSLPGPAAGTSRAHSRAACICFLTGQPQIPTRGPPRVLVMAFHRSPLVSFPKKHVGEKIFSFYISSFLTSRCGQPLKQPGAGSAPRIGAWAALRSTGTRGHQQTCQERCSRRSRPGSRPGPAPDPFCPFTGAGENAPGCFPSPQPSGSCMKTHICSRQTTPAAPAFAGPCPQAHRITESQNSRGWKGPLWVI